MTKHKHFPGKPGLARCSFKSQSLVMLILSILTGQAKTLEVGRLDCPQGTSGYAPPAYINLHLRRGFKIKIFTGQTPFLLLNEQHQSTEAKELWQKTTAAKIHWEILTTFSYAFKKIHSYKPFNSFHELLCKLFFNLSCKAKHDKLCFDES